MAHLEVFFIILQEAGTVLHLAKSGRLIVKAASLVHDGAFLVDENGRRAGKVMETIGPVSSPYLSVQPATERIERIIGTKVFISESHPRRAPDEKQFSQFRSNKLARRRHVQTRFNGGSQRERTERW